MNAIQSTNFPFAEKEKIYHGKVRDVYDLDTQLIMIATDRISAFDHILPKPIPFKGQVLNQTAEYFLKATQDIVPNWLVASPDPNVSIGLKCEPIKLEMVVRGYLAGHAWREYRDGKRTICGIPMPEGMKENDQFPHPIITPATKADEGHDEDISRKEILEKNIVSKDVLDQLEKYSLLLFNRGTELADKQGLILVDTKYEFGYHNGDIYLIDEIHTPDSSRFFYSEGYSERQRKGEKQKQLSKEFVREWLMENDFQGLDGQEMPVMPDEFVDVVSQRYIELYEKVTGKTFVKADTDNIEKRIQSNVENWLAKNE